MNDVLFVAADIGDGYNTSEPVTPPPIDVHTRNCLVCNNAQLQLATHYIKVGVVTGKTNVNLIVFRKIEFYLVHIMHDNLFIL